MSFHWKINGFPRTEQQQPQQKDQQQQPRPQQHTHNDNHNSKGTNQMLSLLYLRFQKQNNQATRHSGATVMVRALTNASRSVRGGCSTLKIKRTKKNILF